jgi:hypothetical protein
MNEQNIKSGSMMQSALVPGLIMGVISIAFSVLTYAFDYQGGWVSLISGLITIGLITYFTIEYRNKKRDGFISYGQALGFGTLISLVSSVLGGIYTYLLVTVIDPNIIPKQLEKARQALEEKGSMSEEQIEQGMKFVEMFATPLMSTMSAIIGGIFLGFIISLIVSAFVKRNNPQQDYY